MKNNLRKILSGLALVAMTTGCGLTKHSSPADSSPAANSSSETPSSSVNDSSSTGPVDTYEVSEDEWKAAMDLTNYTNVTVDLEMGINISNPLADFMSQSATGTATLKNSDGKASVVQESVEYLSLIKEKLLAMAQEANPGLEITDDMLKTVAQNVFAQLLGEDITIDAIVETETDYTVAWSTTSMEAYVAKANDDLVDFYEYYDEAELFVKQRTFGDFNGVIAEFLDSGCFLADKYSAAEFDEETNKYYLGTDVLAKDFNLGDNDTVDIYYSFLNGKITNVDFALSYAADGMNFVETYSYTFKDYGATSVTLPAAESVYACEHENKYEDYNEDYHYTACAICDSVIDYEAHTYGIYDCEECGYYPTSEESVTVAGFNLTIITNTHSGDVIEVSFVDLYETVNKDWDYEGEGDKYISDDTTNYVIETFEEETAAGTTCLIKTTTTYKFYNADGEEVADPIVAISYRESHETEYFENAIDSCHTRYTEVCSVCGETTYDYTDEKHEWSFELLTPADEENEIAATGKITCTNCGTSYTGECEIEASWFDNSIHEIWMDNGESLELEHEFNADGVCELCGAEEVHYCEGPHTDASYEILMEMEEDVYYGYYFCDDCGYEVEALFTYEDNGDGTHTMTVKDVFGEYIDSSTDEHYDEWTLEYLGFDSCPCGVPTHEHVFDAEGNCECGGHSCVGEHTGLGYEANIFTLTEEGTGVVDFYCEDCDWTSEGSFALVDNGDGTHSFTILDAEGNVVEQDTEEHYDEWTLEYLGLSSCPCSSENSGSTEEHTHSYYVKDVTMLDVESGTATLCCEGCDYERDYAFTVTNMDPNKHQFMDSGEDNWVDFSAPHDFSNGDCYCGAKAPATDGHYCEGDHTSEKFVIIDTDGETGTANHYCDDCDYNERVSFVVKEIQGSSYVLECTRADGSTYTYVYSH